MSPRKIALPPPAPTPPLGDQGQFSASAPTDGRELMAAWELPSEAWEQTTVKTFRPVLGTRTETLVDSRPLPEWSLDELASRLGPGTYRMSPGPGPYRNRTATVHIAEEYARAAGYGAPPPQMPRAVEAVAARTIQAAQQGPTDPLQLLAAFEAMLDRRLAQLQPQQGPADALALVMKGFELSNQMIARSMETARTMTAPPPAPVEREPATFADVLLQLGPQLLATVQQAMRTPAPPPATPRPPQPTAGTLPPAQAPAAPPQEAQDMPAHDPEVAAAVAALTQAEQDAIAPAVGLFAPYASKLTPMLGKMPASMLASQVAGYIGPEMVESCLALAAAAQRGPAILGTIHPALNSADGKALVDALALELENRYPMEPEA